ncbi:MAG: hypothetical protein U1F76_32170 [Candidatus Competibacteraceae bacterium]
MKEQASNSTQGWQGMYLWDETARTLAWIGGLDMRTGRLILHYVDSDTLIPTGDAGFIDRMEMMARWGHGLLALYHPNHPFIYERKVAIH